MRKTAEAIGQAPAAAAKAVGSAIMSPVRFLIMMGGLALIGFTGISVFDLQWTAGIATGVGLTAVTWVGSNKVMKICARRLCVCVTASCPNVVKAKLKPFSTIEVYPSAFFYGKPTFTIKSSFFITENIKIYPFADLFLPQSIAIVGRKELR